MRRGFTLVELLVTVAIITVLTAIALPNLLNASTRARVARAQSEMRVIQGALEAYHADWGCYPPSTGTGAYDYRPLFSNPVHQRLIPLTSPVAHLTTLPRDAFPAERFATTDDAALYTTYDYVDTPNPTGAGSGVTSGGAWRLCSAGPDGLLAFGGRTAAEPRELNDPGVDYDPTNGTRSAGDLVCVGAPVATPNGRSASDLTNPERPAILRAPSHREQY